MGKLNSSDQVLKYGNADPLSLSGCRFPGLATFSDNFFSSFFNDFPPAFQSRPPTSPTRANSENWMRNFAARDFEDLDFPEPGVNPFMDAFGCEWLSIFEQL